MNKNIKVGFLTSMVLAFVACTPHKNQPTLDSKSKAKAENFILMLKESSNNVLSTHEIEGIELLYKGSYQKASEKFSLALAFSPQSGSAHFLNALAYHLLAKEGNTNKAELAEVGYGLAKNFSPDNVYASYYHGILNFENKKYREAQQNFADALILRPNDPKILYALSVASYYSHDLQVAAGAIAQAIRLDPTSSKYLHAAALIMAAEGKEQEAQEYANQLIKTGASKGQLEFLTKRIKEWKQFHNGLLKKASWSVDNTRLTQTDKTDTSEEKNHDDDMVIVDVVIILAEEDLNEAQGVNLLTGLQLTFGTPASASSFSTSSTTTAGFLNTRAINNGSLTRSIITNVSIPSVTYSLNIANIQGSNTEILARPSLVARHGKMSKFFSGDVLTIGLAGSAGGNPTYKDNKVGVNLQVTPRILGDGQVNLQITASRNFFKQTNNNVSGFQNSLQVSDTEITADVVLNIGDTLILGGLSEKQQQTGSDSTPFLGDIPIIQQLFNRKTTALMNRSVIILVTPRFPSYTYQTENTRKKNAHFKDGDNKTSNLEDLKARYVDWFKPYPNLASAFHHIDSYNLYREFRTGDVQLEQWNRMDDLMDRIQSSMEFLYY